MANKRPANPNTSSRASTVLRDSTEPQQSAITSPASTLRTVPATPPRTSPSKTGNHVPAQSPQNVLQHFLALEHGVDLNSKCMIHEQILCANSQHMRNFSTKAEVLREIYEKCEHLLDCLESITMVDNALEQYEKKKLEAKLLSLIQSIESKYPFQEYQKTISKLIATAIERQFTNKNVIQSAEMPKGVTNFRGLSLNKRLSLLNSEGALEVAEELCAHLHRLKAAEKQKAKNNTTKAWAQGRLLLRGASETSVLSFVEWAYRATLPCDAEQLYDLWDLATRLKVEVLAEECMDRLFQAASSGISKARSNGTPLRHLLCCPTEKASEDVHVLSDHFVTTVFRHVLQDENPPQRLSELVIDAMARGMDSELWANLGGTINQVITRQLVRAMIAYKETKTEQSDGANGQIKVEGSHAADNSMPNMAESHHGSTLTG